MMIPMRRMRRPGASSFTSSSSSSSMRRQRQNIERDTLQMLMCDLMMEFDEEIRPLESEIELNLKSIRDLQAQESRYLEAKAVLMQCSQEYLNSLEEGYL